MKKEKVKINDLIRVISEEKYKVLVPPYKNKDYNIGILNQKFDATIIVEKIEKPNLARNFYVFYDKNTGYWLPEWLLNFEENQQLEFEF